MKTSIRIATIVIAATALSGCKGFSDFFAFKGNRTQSQATAAAVFGADELEKGRLALRAGYPANAIEQFRLAALNEEVAPDAFNGMGVAYAKLGRADLAERYFKMALTMDASNPRFAANLTRFYASDLGQSARALAMREKEAEETLARAEATAKAEGLLEEIAPEAQLGQATEEVAPVRITRAANRELMLTTSEKRTESGSNLASVAVRRPSSNSVADAVEAATTEAVEKKRRQTTVVSLLGLGSESDARPTRIRVLKPGSQGATRPRARSYPIRIALKPTTKPTE